MSNETQQGQNSRTLNQELLSVAGFTPITDENGRTLADDRQRQLREEVHFNPETLDITFTNTVQKGRSNQPAQTVSDTTSKLSVELIFDTTLDGTDVRAKTIKIAKFMDPDQRTIRRQVPISQTPEQRRQAQAQNTPTPTRTQTTRKKIPAIVVFQWGTIWFEGYIDNFKERLELFSAQGIPLRSVVTISMTQQQRNVDPLANDRALAAQRNSGVGSGNLALHNNEIPPNTQGQRSADNQSVTQTAQNMGDPGAGRRIATQNGIENMRFPEVDVMAITDILQRRIQPITPFNIQGEVAVSGSSAMRFSGLHSVISPQATLTPRTSLRIDPVERRDRNLSIGPNTTFGVGGDVIGSGSASLSADVGVDADLQLDIHFEE